MARGISDYGNGFGLIYILNDKADAIEAVFNNTPKGARAARGIGAHNAPLSQGRSAVATITVTGCAAAGNITHIKVNTIDQVATIACATSTPSVFAATIAAAINIFTPASGPKFFAQAVGAVVQVSGPAGDDSVNALPIVITVDNVTITTTTTNFVNGSAVGGEFDPIFGNRIFLDADYGPSGITGSTPADPTSTAYAVEVTKYLTVRGNETGYPKASVVLSSDKALSIDRYSAHTYLVLDTEGGIASDNVNFISTTDFVEGDVLILRSLSTARTVTVKNSASSLQNIFTSLAADFILAGNTNSITLYYSNDPVNGPSFYEVSRTGDQTTKPTLINIRDNGIPEPKPGVTSTVLTSGGGTINLSPGVSKQVLKLTGSATLSASWTIQGAGTPMDGDEFYVFYQATMTGAGNTITIFGNVLTDDQALTGGLLIYAKYDAGSTSYLTSATLDESLSSSGLKETLIIPVSFETGEQCINAFNPNYNCVITRILANVTKVIAGTDNATITPLILGVPITGGLITLPAGTALGSTIGTAVLTTNNFVPAGSQCQLVSAKTTAGGKTTVTILITRTA